MPDRPNVHVHGVMRIRLTCPECAPASESGSPSGGLWMAELDLDDTNAYSARCPNGHLVRAVLQNPRYEILFDAATLALRDGYNREAIATYACALERFFEFFVRCTFFHLAAIHRPTPSWAQQVEAFEAAWKLAKHSERQLGMFVLAHVLLTGAAPDLGDHAARMSERNSVVHAGTLVSREQALDFGEYVFGIIRRVGRVLDEHCFEAMNAEASRQIVTAHKRLPASESKWSPATIAAGTLIATRLRTEADFRSIVYEFSEWNAWEASRAEAVLERTAALMDITFDELIARLNRPSTVERGLGGDGSEEISDG